MGSFKAAGPDRMPSLFYKSYWNIVGAEVVSVVRDFFVTGTLHPYINSSNIVLVPKSQSATTVNHYRPIAVCNVIYKAYDRLSWRFLETVLRAFGFHPRWIHWIMTCCTTTRMTLILNGSPFNSFKPKRGLRQRDPISPYLFILCMEVLSRLINRKAKEGLIKGFVFPGILLQSITCFSLTMCSSLANALLMKRSILRVALMSFMLDSKLAGWKARALSKAKKLTIINSVALSLPIYVMQSTKISASIYARLDARIRSFWWGYLSNGRNSICLKAWDALCRSKSCGGIGFRKMDDFNKALLSKWGWNLISGTTSFCLDILRSCYLLWENFLDAIVKPAHSPFWKAIMACRDVLKLGACYLVGDGWSIDPWKDPWVPNIPTFRPQLTTTPSASNIRVKDFIIEPGF
ncbi:hypothetical protein UlMin_022520 [Ulmus minor]